MAKRTAASRAARPASSDAPAAGARIKVEAIADGYYDHIYRRAGDVFSIAGESDFSEKWMQYVGAGTREKVTGAQEALSREHGRLTREAAGTESVGPDTPTGAEGVLGD